MIEASHEKLTTKLQDEIDQRENIQRKIFQINEGFSNKFATMQKGMEESFSLVSEQIQDLKTMLFDKIGNSHKSSTQTLEDLSKRFEAMEKEHNSIINEHKAFKLETNEKILSLDDSTNKCLNIAKKDIFDALAKIE